MATSNFFSFTTSFCLPGQFLTYLWLLSQHHNYSNLETGNYLFSSLNYFGVCCTSDFWNYIIPSSWAKLILVILAHPLLMVANLEILERCSAVSLATTIEKHSCWCFLSLVCRSLRWQIIQKSFMYATWDMKFLRLFKANFSTHYISIILLLLWLL